MAHTPETPQAIELGLLLLKFRKRAGLSQQGLGAQLGISHSAVSRREDGKLGLTDTQLGAHLGALGVTGDDYDQALTIHASAANRNWIAAGVDRQVAVLSAYEAAAKVITNVQPALIPGPLQTRETAVDLGRRRGLTVEDAERNADFRLSRSERIIASGLPFNAYIGEYALRFPACDDDVHLPQLRRLLELGELPHVTIRVVALGKRYTAMRAGSFVLIEMEEAAVVHLEHLESSTMMTDERYVKRYIQAATTLRSEAMRPTTTTDLIAQLIDEMERT